MGPALAIPSLLRFSLLTSAVALLAACPSTTRSTNIDTAGMFVTYSLVSTDAPEVRAVAEFRVEDAGGTYLDLVGGDGIAIDGMPMGPIDGDPPSDDPAMPRWPGLHYEAEVPPAADHLFTFTRRGEPAVSRRLQEAIRPAPTIEGQATVTAAYGEPVVIAWAPLPGSTVDIVAVAAADTSICITKTVADAIADVGVYELDPANLHPADQMVECAFVVTVSRIHDEAIGAPFRGGALRTIATGSLELLLR